MASTAALVKPSTLAITAPLFAQDHFVVQKRLLSSSPAVLVVDQAGDALAYVSRPAFSDELRVFTDKTRSLELLRIRACPPNTLGRRFEVTDSLNQETAGIVSRRPWRSVLREEWCFFKTDAEETGCLREDHALKGVARKFLLRGSSRSFSFECTGGPAGTARQSIRNSESRLCVTFSQDSGNVLDRRLAAAAAVLIMVPGRWRPRTGRLTPPL